MQQILKWLTSFGLICWFVRRPSRIFAIMYLLGIPLFAGIYALMPNQFYHSTVQNEPAYFSELASVRDATRTAIVENIRSHYQSDFAKINGWIVNVGDTKEFSVSTPVIEEENIQLPLYVVAINPDKRGLIQLNSSFKVTFPLRHFAFATPPAGFALFSSIDQSLQTNIAGVQPFDYNGLFPYAPNPSILAVVPRDYGKENSVVLTLPYSLYIRYENLWRAKHGFPSDVAGNLGRMLYLSVITITTVGYGDIVPLTPWARFFVGAEAVYGIVFIGLFINSLFVDRHSKSDMDNAYLKYLLSQPAPEHHQKHETQNNDSKTDQVLHHAAGVTSRPDIARPKDAGNS